MKKRKFADIIIAICLGACAVITAATLVEYHRLDTVMPSGVLTALLGVWGGELLIVALRQIFGSDVMAKSNYKSNDSEGSI